MPNLPGKWISDCEIGKIAMLEIGFFELKTLDYMDHKLYIRGYNFWKYATLEDRRLDELFEFYFVAGRLKCSNDVNFIWKSSNSSLISTVLLDFVHTNYFAKDDTFWLIVLYSYITTSKFRNWKRRFLAINVKRNRNILFGHRYLQWGHWNWIHCFHRALKQLQEFCFQF